MSRERFELWNRQRPGNFTINVVVHNDEDGLRMLDAPFHLHLDLDRIRAMVKKARKSKGLKCIDGPVEITVPERG